MRNLSIKSNFTKPLTANSFRKTQREYPQPKQIDVNKGKERMHEQRFDNLKIRGANATKTQHVLSPELRMKGTKENSDRHEEEIASQTLIMKTQPMLTHQMSEFRYHFTTQNSFPITDRNSNFSHDDPTCIWFKNIQKTPTNKQKYIQFGKTQYVITNCSEEQFPNVIFICMDGMIGFFDINGIATDRVAALQLCQITPAVDQSQLRTYQLRYVLSNPIRWKIPSELTHIKLSVKTDDSPDAIMLPLPNPISIQIQIGQS